jgi:fructan beta-fructosidase
MMTPKKLLSFIGLGICTLCPPVVNAQADPLFNPKHLNFESYKDIGYNQKYRPQFHFTSRKNWLNDPNGMIYYAGEYHMFFQHHALKNANGTKSWGHAVSSDMIHWTQLDHAIVPYKIPNELISAEFAKKWDGEVAIWSGTTVIDHKNVLGKQVGNTKTMVAYFTATARPEFFQAAAYSTDKGRTFKLLKDGGIILPNQGLLKGERDPKVFWHEASQKYVMLIWMKAGEWGNKDKLSGVRFFTSENLLDWKATSSLDRKWFAECMDIVEIPVDGDINNKKWVLYDASFDYEIGDFDGEKFKSDKVTLKGDYGFHYYAAQTFNNSPDGRSIMIGWLNDRKHSPFVETNMPFDQQMSIPTNMTLRTSPKGIRLFRWPVKEIENLYIKTKLFNSLNLSSANKVLNGLEAELIDFSIELEPTKDLEFNFRGIKVKYDFKEQTLQPTKILNKHHQNHKLPAPLVNGKLRLRVLIDLASIEIFVNEGEFVGTYLGLTETNNKSVSLNGETHTKVNAISFHQLKSIWKKKETLGQ